MFERRLKILLFFLLAVSAGAGDSRRRHSNLLARLLAAAGDRDHETPRVHRNHAWFDPRPQWPDIGVRRSVHRRLRRLSRHYRRAGRRLGAKPCGAESQGPPQQEVQGRQAFGRCRSRVFDEECDRVRGDVAAMWRELAAVGGKTPDQIDEIRRDIVRRVEMLKRYEWWRGYEQAMQRSKGENSSSWYRQFMSDNAPDESTADKFEVEVHEEISPHVILHNIPPEIQARLARQEDRYFCLSLQPSKYRQYPFGRAACNVLGYLDTARTGGNHRRPRRGILDGPSPAFLAGGLVGSLRHRGVPGIAQVLAERSGRPGRRRIALREHAARHARKDRAIGRHGPSG